MSRRYSRRSTPALLLSACIAAFIFTSLSAQPSQSLAFEAASVKSVPPSERRRISMEGGPETSDPTRLTYAGVPLKQLFVVAYGVKADQILGPEWLDSDRVDISAKIAPGASRQDFHVMLQTLLAERFGVTLHREQKAISTYRLTVAKNGPKSALKASSPPDEGDISKDKTAPVRLMRRADGECRLVAANIGMEGLASLLQERISQRVADATGLKGSYQFELHWSEDVIGGMPFHGPTALGFASEGGADTSSSPTIFKALREQLGLVLESGGASSVDRIVIDHMNRTPTPN